MVGAETRRSHKMTYRTPNSRPYPDMDMMMMREGLPSVDALRSELENGRRTQAHIRGSLGQFMPNLTEIGSMVVAWISDREPLERSQARWS